MDIQELRARIDRIDEKLVPLFLERMGVSLKVAEYKAENHLPVLDRARERALLKKVSEKTDDPDLQLYTRLLYSSIMGLSRSYQHKQLDKNETTLEEKLRAAIKASDKKDLPQDAVVACQGACLRAAFQTAGYFVFPKLGGRFHGCAGRALPIRYFAD